MSDGSSEIKVFSDIKEVEDYMTTSKAKAILLGIVAFFVIWGILYSLNHPIAGFFIAMFLAYGVYFTRNAKIIYEERLPFTVDISTETLGKIAAILSGLTKINFKVDENTGEIYGPLKLELSKISAMTIGTGAGMGYGGSFGVGIGGGIAHTSGEVKPSKEDIGKTRISLKKDDKGVAIRGFFEVQSRQGKLGADVIENVITIMKSILANQST